MDNPYFLEFCDITFSKSSDIIFKNINWKIENGQSWAIVGATGSGKTTFVEAIAGKYYLQSGKILYYFLEKLRKSEDETLYPSDFISLITFKENSKIFNYANFYYQQRYNASEADDAITVERFLRDSAGSDFDKIIHLLGIEELLPLSFIKLSNGQTRKTLIANALLKSPKLLILDNPFIGLDADFRKNLLKIIDDLIENGAKIILITQPGEIPEKITHILQLENFTIKDTFTKTDFLKKSKAEISGNPAAEIISFQTQKVNTDYEIAVRFQDVNIRYGEKQILKNIDFTIKKGEKWALLGPNGSGKTTILSLINADNPQGYANDIWLFDKKRGSGESIWDIKKKIGFISPELHLYFAEDLTAYQVAATGFFDTLFLNKKLTDEQESILSNFFTFYEIIGIATKSFLRLSSGEQRVVLIIRSLVKSPPLLIMDEPFQGLDEKTIFHTHYLIENLLPADQTLIFVSHYEKEIPSSVNHFLFLKGGKIEKII